MTAGTRRSLVTSDLWNLSVRVHKHNMVTSIGVAHLSDLAILALYSKSFYQQLNLLIYGLIQEHIPLWEVVNPPA